METQIVAIARKKRGRTTRISKTEGESKEKKGQKDTQPCGLANALWAKMSASHETTKDLAQAIEITYPYLMALIRNERKFCDAGRLILERAAKYLNVPVAHAYLLAGALQPQDFFFDDKLPTETDSLYNALSTHKMWSGFAPDRTEWDSMPNKTRLLICLLFQEAVQRSILSSMSIEIPAAEPATSVGG